MNVLPLSPDEKVTVVLPVVNFHEAEYITMVTRQARIKRVEVGEFENIRVTGLIAVNLDAGDELGWAKLTHGNEHLIMVTQQGQAIRFDEEDVRPMGRAAAGVNAMKLADGDRLAGMDVVTADDDLLVITEGGYGKRTPLDEYRCQHRYGGGVRAMVLREPEDRIVAARVVHEDDEVTCISTNGIILRTAVTNISRQGRITHGVRVIDVKDGDAVASVAVIREGRYTQATDAGVAVAPV